MHLVRRISSRMLLAGALAGVLGGLVGSVAKIAGEAVYPPRTLGQVPPPLLLAERVAGHPLSPPEGQLSIQTIHFTFGALVGGIYGATAEAVPLVMVGSGVVFGLVLQLFTHETAVPALGLDVPAPQQPLREHLSEFFTHALFGLGTELTRRVVRRRLAPPVPAG